MGVFKQAGAIMHGRYTLLKTLDDFYVSYQKVIRHSCSLDTGKVNTRIQSLTLTKNVGRNKVRS